MNLARWLTVGVIALALLFAAQGGEYSTTNWLELRRREREERARVAELKRMVDSLERTARAIERDPKVQERIARESFGMIRQGEYLYRLVPPSDSGGER